MGHAETPGRKAGFYQLTFLIFGASCGGAFGAEDMVGASGPGVALLTLLMMPFIFSLPIAFAVAELTAAYPYEGGNYAWSRMAFGDFWGFQAAWWSWMTGVAMNGLYAVLFADYLAGWFPWVAGWKHWVACLGLIWLLHWVNLRGIELVGDTAIVLSLLLLVPFVVMTALGFFNWNYNPISPFVAPGQGFPAAMGGALALGIWLYSGYDRLSNVAEEVENPQKTFPPALVSAAVLALACYVLPTVAGLAQLGNWQEWGRAYYPIAAGKMGGEWLGHAMRIGALCSTALLLNCTILSTSRVPFALARDGLLPSFVANTHPVHGTPSTSLLFGSITYSLLALIDFSQLLIVNAWFQMAANVLVYANVWKLRRDDPGASRPFLIPGGLAGLVLGTVLTGLLAGAAMCASVLDKGQIQPGQLLIGLAAMASGAAVFQTARILRTPRLQ